MNPALSKRPTRKDFLRTVAAGVAVTVCGGLEIACTSSLSGKLPAESARLRSDEPFVIRLTDRSPGEHVILLASFGDLSGKEWSSTAAFEADAEGKVDTSRQAPVGGSYEVADPMGLVWSALGPGDFYAPPLRPGPVRVTAQAGDGEASVKVRRYLLTDHVRSEDIREDGLYGRFFVPAGASSSPGVLVLGGSEGGLAPYVSYEATLLASHGFAALALAYFTGGYFEADPLPKALVDVPLEYFGRAIGWLKERQAVRPDRLGVVGHSRGGELALLLGANYSDLKAVVSYVGSGVATFSPEGEEAAWTLRVKPVPYVKSASEVSEEDLRKAEIPVERTNGPVLLIAAGDDEAWPSARLSEIAQERLKKSDRSYGDEFVVYPDAGHLIQAPYVPTAPGTQQYGGDPRANAKANEDSWRKVLEFLGEGLKG
jgi:dienelactone hydrolase